MSDFGKLERATRDRVIALFWDELKYRYLGDWNGRDGTSNIEEGPLSAWLTKNGYSPTQISVARHKLRTEADNHNRTLFANNQAVYDFLRYGVPVKIEAGEFAETRHLTNRNEPKEASWLNLIEAQFGIPKRFTLANTDDPTHAVRRCRIYAYLRYRHRKLANLRHPLNRIRSFRSIKLEQH